VTDCQEYKEIIAAHVDGALASREEIEAQSHLDECPKCRQMFLWETQVKKSLKPKLSAIPIRPGLKERLLDRLEEPKREGFFGWSYMAHGLAAAVALILIVGVPYTIWQGRVQEELFPNTIAQYKKVAQGISEIPPVGKSLTSAARLLDLSPWGYRVLARQIHNVRGQERRVFVYQGPDKDYLLAQEFEGGEYSTPVDARTIRGSNHDFISYSQEGVNVIAWEERDTLCVLASSLPEKKLLGLAQNIALGN